MLVMPVSAMAMWPSLPKNSKVGVTPTPNFRAIWPLRVVDDGQVFQVVLLEVGADGLVVTRLHGDGDDLSGIILLPGCSARAFRHGRCRTRWPRTPRLSGVALGFPSVTGWPDNVGTVIGRGVLGNIRSHVGTYGKKNGQKYGDFNQPAPPAPAFPGRFFGSRVLCLRFCRVCHAALLWLVWHRPKRDADKLPGWITIHHHPRILGRRGRRYCRLQGRDACASIARMPVLTCGCGDDGFGHTVRDAAVVSGGQWPSGTHRTVRP